MQAVILLGGPGAGKGTAAEGITESTNYIHVSTGHMLREAVEAGSAVGLEAKAYMDKGELVPDKLIMQMVTARLESGTPDAKYMFDGFPRTLEQARLLDEVLESHRAPLRQVFLLEVPEDILVRRIAGRRICRDCGAVYHVSNIPPRREGVCDSCGGALYQRADDSESTVLNRISVFKKQTESLIHYYEAKGMLLRIDASHTKEQTDADILKYLGEPTADA